MADVKLRKRGLAVALGLFLGVGILAIVVNSVLQQSLRVNWSISTYVGLRTWSAVAFALCNCAVAGLIGNYLWKVGQAWSMPKLYYYACFLMLVALIWLSFCPIGYFDNGARTGVISNMHQVASRSMFVLMLIVTAMLAGRPNLTGRAQVALASFIVYALLCLVGYMTQGEWFTSFFMIYETLYLAWFVIALMVSE